MPLSPRLARQARDGHFMIMAQEGWFTTAEIGILRCCARVGSVIHVGCLWGCGGAPNDSGGVPERQTNHLITGRPTDFVL